MVVREVEATVMLTMVVTAVVERVMMTCGSGGDSSDKGSGGEDYEGGDGGGRGGGCYSGGM